jgi:hypothetical protein
MKESLVSGHQDDPFAPTAVILGKRPTATFGPIGRGTPAGDWVGGEAFQPRVAQRLGVSAVSRSAAVEFRCRRNPGDRRSRPASWKAGECRAEVPRRKQTDRPSGASDRGDGNAAQSPFACRRYRSADHGQRRGWRFRPEEWGHPQSIQRRQPAGLEHLRAGDTLGPGTADERIQQPDPVRSAHRAEQLGNDRARPGQQVGMERGRHRAYLHLAPRRQMA